MEQDQFFVDNLIKYKVQLHKYEVQFVTTWVPVIPDIRKALHKFTNVSMGDEKCREVFPKGSFKGAYKKGHKNLKEIIAKSRSMFARTEGPVDRNRLGREGG